MPWRTSVQHGIPSWMDPTSCYQKTDSTFYVKKTEKKLVSQNFGPLKSNIMLENSIFSSPFLLFTFWESAGIILMLCSSNRWRCKTRKPSSVNLVSLARQTFAPVCQKADRPRESQQALNVHVFSRFQNFAAHL